MTFSVSSKVTFRSSRDSDILLIFNSFTSSFFSLEKSNFRDVGEIIKSALYALVTLIRPEPVSSTENFLPYESVTGSVVVTRIDFISLGFKSGFFSSNNAIVPLTCGAA